MSFTTSASPKAKVFYSTQDHTGQVTTTRGRANSTCNAASSTVTNATSTVAAAATASANTRTATAAASCTALSQASTVKKLPLTDSPHIGKFPKTIVTKTAQKPSPATVPAQQQGNPTQKQPVSAAPTQGTRVITTRAANGREQFTLSEVPFSVGGAAASVAGVVPTQAALRSPAGTLRSRSISPKRNYTPRRGRGGTVATTDACSTHQVRSGSLPREYWTYCSVSTDGYVPTRYTQPTPSVASTVASTTASTTHSKSSGEAPVAALRGTTLQTTKAPTRSSSPADVDLSRLIECRAVFMHQGRSWKFSLPPESSVNDAISTATQQVLRNVVETDRRLGEKLSINVLPSITDTSTVAEWAHRNLEQPPLIIIKSEIEDSFAQQKPEFDAQNIQRLMEEQTRLLTALQKQLGEQTAIIRNQASFISELQAREKQHSQQLGEAVSRIENDIAGMKGQLLTLEEHMTKAGNENHGRKGRT